MKDRRFICALGCLAIFLLAPVASALSVKIVYPKPGQVVSAIDSTFILGHIVEDGVDDFSEYRVKVNGVLANLNRDGGFLAFVPVTGGDFYFRVVAELTSSASRMNQKKVSSVMNVMNVMNVMSVMAELMVSIPKPIATLPFDTLQIIGGYGDPRGDLVLADGDMLNVQFRGTPGARAWFSLPGVVDSVPMSETEPKQQPFWGESVFGAGNVPDSVLVAGIYTGYHRISSDSSVVKARIQYNLAPPDKGKILLECLNAGSDTAVARLAALLELDSLVTIESAYQVSINPPDFPFTVRFTDSMQTIRHRPRKGYFSIFQPAGVEAQVVGAEADWYRIQLSRTQFAWANSAGVERLGPGILPPSSYIRIVRTFGFDDSVVVEIPLSGRHPFRVYEDDKRTIRLQLFGVTTDTDWIRYDFSDPLIDIATWKQPEDGLYELTVRLTRDMWGYQTDYVGNTLKLTLYKEPADVHSLSGKRIVIDPGHSGDPGSIGPTGYTEAEANLAIALVLAKQLKRKGAIVTLTRNSDENVPLYDRPSIAKAVDADIFVSIHNNALPDGVNPFENNGVSTYYYHPHSIDLARAIQREIVPATGLRDHGLYHGNLAVDRPTQYPAVLVECAFMILPDQEALLKTNSFRERVSKGILRGIEQFLSDFDGGR